MPKIPGISSFTSKKLEKDTATEGLKNDLIIRAARGEKTERTPVWVMRQAGRYLPEFRKLRAEYEFFKCCRDPELASEITLQPIRRYEGLIDAAVIFSDILVVPQAMGMEVEMIPGKGPSFLDPLNTPKDMDRLKRVDVEKDLGYVLEAIRLTKIKLAGRVPIIGFCGSPWTLMAYMIEGGGSKTWEKAKRWIFDHPEESKRLLKRIASVCAEFLVAQVRAGAQLLQVFDSWAGELTPDDFRTFSLPYMTSIATEVKDTLATTPLTPPPMIVYAKGAVNHSLPELCKAGYDVIGIDHTVTPSWARKVVHDSETSARKFKTVEATRCGNHRIALQGNLDPAVLYAKPEVIYERVRRMFQSSTSGFGGNGALICNLGHGITPNVDPEHMRAFLMAVHRVSREVIADDDA
ncbi:uroporphyrinogen decarboxylase [Malassezia pachydermatis]|uniref:Uroporphyrinogen decarboxylase n=1 Tax=Malassezia pachydermatis TaxID=77020 RepID=A0A0M8MPV6_9BASI|nr:uroporphyrinogen decarboxylase [Malassezia pachydermatis]KOS15938.1 uroporphyrinogen decarboxylase [Malassezia pachydermatis]